MARMAKWLVENMYKSYLTTIPVRGVMSRAGFDPNKPAHTARVERGVKQPPQELVNQIVGSAVQ